VTNKHTQGTCGTEKLPQIMKPMKTGKIPKLTKMPKKKLRKDGLRQRTSTRNKPNKTGTTQRKYRKVPDLVPPQVLPEVLWQAVLAVEATEVNRPLLSAMKKETTVYI